MRNNKFRAKQPKGPGLPGRIRKARRRKGYTRGQLAGLLGISLSHMAELENGEALPTVGVLQKLCLTLNVSADYLLFGTRAIRRPG